MSDLLDSEKTRHEELVQTNIKIDQAIFKKNTYLMDL